MFVFGYVLIKGMIYNNNNKKIEWQNKMNN